MPSAERMLTEYAAQADRARGHGNTGLAEHARCLRLAQLLSDVVAKDLKVRIVRTL